MDRIALGDFVYDLMAADTPPRGSLHQEHTEDWSEGRHSEEDDDNKSKDSDDSMTTCHNSSKDEGAFMAEQQLDNFKAADKPKGGLGELRGTSR